MAEARHSEASGPDDSKHSSHKQHSLKRFTFSKRKKKTQNNSDPDKDEGSQQEPNVEVTNSGRCLKESTDTFSPEKPGFDHFNPKAIGDEIAQILLHTRNKDKKETSKRGPSSKKTGHKRDKKHKEISLKKDKLDEEGSAHLRRIPEIEELDHKPRSGAYVVHPFPTNNYYNNNQVNTSEREDPDDNDNSKKGDSGPLPTEAFRKVDLAAAQRILSLAEAKHDHPPIHRASRNAGYFRSPWHRDIDMADPNGRTFLHQAALNGNLDFVHHLIDNGAKVNVRTTSNRTPLHEAAEMGHMAIAKALIKHGAKVNVQDKWQCTPLHKAVVRDREDMAQLLLNYGACDFGGNLLQCAILSNMDNIVQLMIERGAEVNATDITGQTPLHSAAKYGQANIVSLLINSGASINKVSRGIMELDYDLILQGAHRQLSKLKLDKYFQDGVSPLRVAQEYGHSDLVVTLVNYGANVTICDSKGQFPHHKATLQHDCVSLHRILGHPHCPIDILDMDGCSALYIGFKSMRKCHAGFCSSQNSLQETVIDTTNLQNSDEDYVNTTIVLLQHGADYAKLDVYRYLLMAYHFSERYKLRIFQAIVHSGNDLRKILFYARHVLLSKQGREDLYYWLFQFACQPRSLKDQCRHTIRYHLRMVHRRRSIWQAVQRLPLPGVLHDFLLLQEFQHVDLSKHFTTLEPTLKYPIEWKKKTHRHHCRHKKSSKC